MLALWQGFALGLSTGAFCLATCAPGIVPTLLLEERPERWVPWGHMLKFLAGRLLAYLLVGWAGGYVGMRWGQGLPSWAFGWAWIVLAGLLVLQSFPWWRKRVHLPPPRWTRTIPFLSGFLVGLSPCLPFWLALTAVLERGRPAEGLSLFAAFFLSTSLFLLPLGFLGRLSRHGAIRQVARWTALLVGAVFLVVGLERVLV